MHTDDNAEALLRILREPRRNKYFYGKRMDVQHFRMEQDYGKLKQWLLNRLTLGKGVLCGLQVSVSDGRVCVAPGVAIDGLGREIIVPMRYCLDPVVIDGGCCALHRASPAPAADGVVDGLFTLWLCYRECVTDHQPVLVSKCGTRDECAGGTVVETFCLKLGEGIAPPLGDPDWCAKLWGMGGNQLAIDVPADQQAAAVAAIDSRRHLLCDLFDGNCDPAEDNLCVPLALVQVKDGQVTLEGCLVSPRIYSNQRLLDLILCLADKIDACCGEHPPTERPLQVGGIDLISRNAAGTETLVAAMATPMQDTAVDINGKTNAIRIRFTKPLVTDQHKPTTHGLGDADFKLHNVQVLPERPLNNLPYVPGTLVLEQPDTIRFDLFIDSPYSRGTDGWQKGRYQILLRGDEDLAQNRQALAGNDDKPLDGEPIAPAGGVISGDGAAGGDFSAFFVVGAGPTPEPSLLHVRRIEFLGFANQVVDAVSRPDKTVELREHIAAIRFNFDNAFAPSGAKKPNVAGLNDPSFKTHNVQLRLPREFADRFGTPFIASKLSVEDATTFRLDFEQGTRLINQDGRWRANLRVDCEIFLRGNAEADGPELADANGMALDGEPKPPSGGLMSGNDTPGGDFTANFTVFIPG
jgi:hypothetical protein